MWAYHNMARFTWGVWTISRRLRALVLGLPQLGGTDDITPLLVVMGLPHLQGVWTISRRFLAHVLGLPQLGGRDNLTSLIAHVWGLPLSPGRMDGITPPRAHVMGLPQLEGMDNITPLMRT